MGTSKYSPEFRADAVALYHSSPGGTYASVVKDLGVSHETLRTWVRDAEQVTRPGAVEATAMEALGVVKVATAEQLRQLVLPGVQHQYAERATRRNQGGARPAVL
ncbi:transposase [Streptomyces sp900116325]|uniref:transposase n=1 Tax=Streptomyces sp. 900116325 TaxID=3154295 RepID=UPI0033BABEB7